MAFYITMFAFIVANLGLIGFEMRKGEQGAGRGALLPTTGRR